MKMNEQHQNYIREKLELQKEKLAFRSLENFRDDLVDFCSNDYLGFAREGLDIGTPLFKGSTGSRLISGHRNYITNIEQKIAQFHHSEAALIFNSGYQANVGIFACLPEKGDTVIFDEYIHASIRDGINLSKAEKVKFLHNDLKDLENKLRDAKGKRWLAIESVYSMDGDCADLKKIAELCKKYDTAILLDEAHAVGIFGEGGSGLAQELHLENQMFLRIVTGGKSLGVQGGIALCSNEVKQYLINFCRSFIYSTYLPEVNVLAIEKSYDKLSNCNHKINNIRKLITYFKAKVEEYDLPFLPSYSCIQSIVISGNERVISVSERLKEAGFFVKPIRYPTVEKSKERLRICLHSYNTSDEIDSLLINIKKILYP